MHLSNDEFFARLHDLFTKKNRKGKGTVFLKQKRLYQTPISTSDPFADLSPSHPVPIFIRASAGHSRDQPPSSRIQFGTVVQPDGLDDFYARYVEACRKGMMASMKKRKREKKKGKKRGKKDGTKEVGRG